jgi:hypothetical protein
MLHINEDQTERKDIAHFATQKVMICEQQITVSHDIIS